MISYFEYPPLMRLSTVKQYRGLEDHLTGRGDLSLIRLEGIFFSKSWINCTFQWYYFVCAVYHKLSFQWGPESSIGLFVTSSSRITDELFSWTPISNDATSENSWSLDGLMTNMVHGGSTKFYLWIKNVPGLISIRRSWLVSLVGIPT